MTKAKKKTETLIEKIFSQPSEAVMCVRVGMCLVTWLTKSTPVSGIAADVDRILGVGALRYPLDVVGIVQIAPSP